MIATIETAIVETIRAARLPYLRYLGTYGGELDGEPQSIVRQTPAVWVSYRDESAPDPRNTGRTRWTVKATFSVLAAARSLKNEEATRHGDAVQVGSYQMIEDVRALIGFNDFGLSGVDYLRPGRTRTLFNGRLARVRPCQSSCRNGRRFTICASASRGSGRLTPRPAHIFPRKARGCRATPTRKTIRTSRHCQDSPCGTG